MVKKIQIILEFDPYIPNPESYPTAKSIEDMANVDIENTGDLLEFLLNEIEFKVYYKIIDEDE